MRRQGRREDFSGWLVGFRGKKEKEKNYFSFSFFGTDADSFASSDNGRHHGIRRFFYSDSEISFLFSFAVDKKNPNGFQILRSRDESSERLNKPLVSLDGRVLQTEERERENKRVVVGGLGGNE
jgi:hypothetical protein